MSQPVSPILIYATKRVGILCSLLMAFGHPLLAHSSESVPGLTSVQADALLYDRCEDCHNDYILDGNWSIEDIDVNDISQGRNLKRWEAILKSVAMGDMPPAEKPPLSDDDKAALLKWLQGSLDQYSQHHPNPGRSTIRRLNRYEYANSVQDLLAIDVDISGSLPGDDSGYGFDNNADVLSMSSTLLERYLFVAGKISRLATGVKPQSASKISYIVPKDGSVKNSGVPAFDLRMHEDLPLDSRGGGSFNFYAPISGRYELAGFLNANTNNEVDRLNIHRRSVIVYLSAGNHQLGMAFRKQLALSEYPPKVRQGTDYVVLPEHDPTPLTLDFIVDGKRYHSITVPSYHMSPRFSQATFLRDIQEIEVIGPLPSAESGHADDASANTPSTRKIFICSPGEATVLSTESPASHTEAMCAKNILANLVKEAYRRPTTKQDIAALFTVYEQARTALNFRASIATAIQALLVSPQFLYLVEQTPDDVIPGGIYRINDFEFAARLALFLWGSLPDQQLFELANSGALRTPAVLRQQIARMLTSEKARALTKNFAGQWLYLRNLPHHSPDVFAFPQFNKPLKYAMQRETELFFTRIVKDNLSVFDFLSADYSYINESLANHYGIDGVNGQSFRKVSMVNKQRGGLLGQASILTLTSNPNHTSPVKRGKWILDNLLAASPPPPPPDIPALVAEHDGIALSAKAQLARHRSDPACAACHKRMDPLGLALEQYDAVGAFRTHYANQPIDVAASMPDGTKFNGLPGLQQVLWEKRERFALAFADRLLTYALGRGLEAYDQPTVRRVKEQASKADYRIQAFIEAVVNSHPFNYKKAPQESHETQQIANAH